MEVYDSTQFIIYMAKMTSMPSFYIEFDIRGKKFLDNKAAKNNIRKGFIHKPRGHGNGRGYY